MGYALMKEEKNKRLLKTEEAMEYLSIGKNELYNLVKEEKIRAIKIGKRSFRFDIFDLDRFIEEMKGQ